MTATYPWSTATWAPTWRPSRRKSVRHRWRRSPSCWEATIPSGARRWSPSRDGSAAGGLTSRQLLDFLRQLRGVRLAGLDVDEVAPPLDVGYVTSLAALKFIFEYIGMVKLGKTA